VLDRAEDQDFHRPGRGGGTRIQDVDRQIHGGRIRAELVDALTDGDATRTQLEPTVEELRALGVVIVLQGTDSAAPLRLDSLERMSTHRAPKPKWLLLSVTPSMDERPEQAMVWVSDQYRQAFLKLFEDYLDASKDTSGGNPKNRELVANIAAIRGVVLRDLWQSAGEPPLSGTHWWELWLHRSGDGIGLLRMYAQANSMALVERPMVLNDRSIGWIQARWADLETLPFTAVPLAEVRRPEFVDTIEDWPRDDQDELLEDLASRVTVAADDAPAVCHLDTGVRRTHALLADSLAPEDMHFVVGDSAGDRQGHGTLMAGLALYGPLDEPLLSSRPVVLRHRLESVKILERRASNDPLAYGVVTAQAASAPEAVSTRRRVFCMPVTCEPEASAGEPSLWSAAVDALAVGTVVGRSDDGIALIGLPDPAAARLFVISAGNVQPHEFRMDYRNVCDTSPVQDPAQAWNALTVGAYTDLAGTPSDPRFREWSPLAVPGDISPLSRTSLHFSRQWPIKPDICMEGGNVLTNGTDFHECHELLSLRTTGPRDDYTISSASATSAATAQAARLAALAMGSYPSYWPETIRGLLVHSAEWTPAMRAEVDAATRKTDRLGLLRRYGWGVPDEDAVLSSTRQSVTLVTQDEFVPFVGPDHRARCFRLHRLPWPTETLRGLAEADVELRVTLSYFIEPTASRRGWRRRYAYQSHGLRFELKGPLENPSAFLARINREAQDEEEAGRHSGGDSGRWLVGTNQRNGGSLHQDIWEGSGAELADCGLIAVHPVGGWWKNNSRKDRAGLPLRYCLIVSLRTREQTADLYTPIATQLLVPVATAVEAT